MQKAHLLTALAMFVGAYTALAGGSVPRPTVARILVVRSESNADWRPVGNISVKFSDGHREIWTTKGHCLLPKVSKSGLVGWTHAIEQHSRGGWMNQELRIARDGRIIGRFHADRAFVDLWDFTDNDTCVVVRGINEYGPYWIQKYRIATGELVAEGSGNNHVPEWAKPYADETQSGD